MPFKKGRQKTGGRTAGTPNKDTQTIKELLLDLLDKRANRKQWEYWLRHKNAHLRFEAFKLAQFYMFGRLSSLLQNSPQQTDPEFDLSAIPTRHVPVRPN
jgi:hypothetical protein